jgi:hypothetical protein
MSILQILRSFVTGVHPTGKQLAEPYVNFADKQFGVFDGTNPIDLIGTRYFSTQANYVIGDHVVQSGKIWEAKSNITAGTFNSGNWNQIATQADLTGPVGGYLPAVGTITNDNATPGTIGEIITSNQTSPVTLATNTATGIANIPLTPGDWDVSGEVWFNIASSTLPTQLACQISNGIIFPGASLPGSSRTHLQVSFIASSLQILPLSTCRASLPSATTYYVAALANFPSGTVTASGHIIARRSR